MTLLKVDDMYYFSLSGAHSEESQREIIYQQHWLIYICIKSLPSIIAEYNTNKS